MRNERADRAYDSVYEQFDSPLMRRLRRDAYGEDIGQHSWVTARELRADIDRLGLTATSRFLDLGCGAGGPLTFVIASVGCAGVGLEVSGAAVESARRRAASLGVERLTTVRQTDLDHPLPLQTHAFDSAVALDVVLHLVDRAAVFREVARVLVPGGRFLFTDAGVKAGDLSDEELASRSLHRPTQLVPAHVNEQALAAAGFRLVETEDRTESLLANAAGRLAARAARRAELEPLEGAAGFERQQRYLATVIALGRRRSVIRVMYLAITNGT